MPSLRHPTYTRRPAPEPVRSQRIVMRWVVAALCVIGLVAIVRGVQGAERTRQHSITLLFDGAALDHVSRSFFTLSGPYADRRECERAKTGLVVMVKGAKLRCDPINPWRVQ